MKNNFVQERNHLINQQPSLKSAQVLTQVGTSLLHPRRALADISRPFSGVRVTPTVYGDPFGHDLGGRSSVEGAVSPILVRPIRLGNMENARLRAISSSGTICLINVGQVK